MYITTQLSFHEILLAPDKEVKRKRESQFSWELRGTKEEGSIKYCTWMNKRMCEKMKDFSVPFSTSIPAPLSGVQTTAVNSGDYVHMGKAWKKVLQKQRLILKELDQLHQTQCRQSGCPHSTSILSFPILHGRHWRTEERAQTLEPVKPVPTSCLHHWPSLGQLQECHES